MMDRFIRGSVGRISPEAPVPVVDVEEHVQHPGGAGNVICNLSTLGAQTSLVSVKGDDPTGDQISLELQGRRINLEGLVVDPSRPTPTKTRVVAHHQQVVRLDVEKRGGISSKLVNQLVEKIKKMMPRHKCVVISDYGKGVINHAVIGAIIRQAARHHVGVIVDPKVEHFIQYRGVDCITPNAKESIEGMRVLPPKNEEGFIELGWKIIKKLNCKSLLMTRGEKGMLLFQKGSPVKTIETHAQEVFDVTGAGDTVVAVLALARAVGASYYEAALLANVAAGIVVGKLGTATVTPDELVERLEKI